MKVEFFKHNINAVDIDRVNDVLNSIFLTTGQTVKEFEESFASYLSVEHAIALTSCTAALHLSLLAWGIGEGDEVITTPMSFCATSNAVFHAGATPVFVDVEKDTGNINAELIEERITDKTRAIMPVHLYGQMCDMKRIRQIADRYGLIVIEDAAHCIEGVRDGVKVGELGDAACFSFYATKNITSGEGGAVAIHDEQKADLLRAMRTHGIDRSAADRYTKLYKHWDMPVLGWKYNMDNIHAALLIGQLERIDSLLSRREAVWQYYEKALADMPEIKILKTLPGLRHARHLFTVLVDPDKRDAVLWAMQEKGVGVAVNYRPIHLLEYYRLQHGYRSGQFPVAEQIGASTISIPLYPKMSESEAAYVVESIKDVLKK